RAANWTEAAPDAFTSRRRNQRFRRGTACVLQTAWLVSPLDGLVPVILPRAGPAVPFRPGMGASPGSSCISCFVRPQAHPALSDLTRRLTGTASDRTPKRPAGLL